MMCAHQSYAESTLKLMWPIPAYDKAAEIIHRSLVENYININYIYSSKKQVNALIFLAYSFQDRIKFANKYKALIIKYPNWRLKFGPNEKPSDWQSFIQK